MLKKILFMLIGALTLFASEFVTLEDGRTIMLKDDGTYEEVTLIINQERNASSLLTI